MAQMDWRRRIKFEMICVSDEVSILAKLFLICGYWVMLDDVATKKPQMTRLDFPKTLHLWRWARSYLLTTWLLQFFHIRENASGLAHPGTMVVSGKREVASSSLGNEVKEGYCEPQGPSALCLVETGSWEDRRFHNVVRVTLQKNTRSRPRKLQDEDQAQFSYFESN